MSIRVNQRWFVWLVLGLCIIAIPVGLLSTQIAKHLEKTDGTGDSILTRFTDHIEVVRLTGMIQDKEDKSFFFASDDSTSTVLKAFRKALKNDHVKGILLRINSPGGTVSASQEVTGEVKAFRKSGRPVVVSMGDMTASGGYYIASAADRILAEPGTLTGSIGVIMHFMNFKGLTEKIGVQADVIKTGQFKDIGSNYRPMTADEKTILQTLCTDSYDQFVTAVAEGRKMNITEVRQIGDGRVYSGRQALKLHLVDELGGYDESLEALQKMCKDRLHLTENLPVEDKSSDGLLSTLMESAASLPALRSHSDAGLLGQLLPESMNPKFTDIPLWMMH
ncbi:MAG: signal peptide peptidase SppA [Candidatus Melainabacteria bacterium]|nr:signal peptide peptidase SppA [Candidatus Melainabacteria bacterium]